MSAIVSPRSWTDVLPVDELFPDPEKPLEVDVGCGKGRFLTARAQAHPDINLLGVDRLLRRLRKIDKKIARLELTNVRLLRIEASYAIRYMLPPSSVTTFYIFYSDPWPKKRHHKRRLFNEDFLDRLFGVLVPGGTVHVATDHGDYFDEIRGLFERDSRYSETPAFEPVEEEKTDFEILFLKQDARIGRGSFRKCSQSSDDTVAPSQCTP